MYKIRLNKRDVLNGCKYTYSYNVYFSAIHKSIVKHAVTVSFYYVNDVFIISVKDNDMITNFKYESYDKARKQLSVFNTYYG